MTATVVTAPHSIVGCAILVLPRFARHSDRREPMPSPSAGSDLSGPSAWTKFSYLTSVICRGSWPSMSAISTTGAPIDRWVNGRLVRRYHARLIETLILERSSRFLCSEAFITFISKTHHDLPDLILAPYRVSSLPRNGDPSSAGSGPTGWCITQLHRSQGRSQQGVMRLTPEY